MRIYYNLGQSGKAVKYQVASALDFERQRHFIHGKRSISAREISQQNLETSTEHLLQKGFVQFQGIMENFHTPISTTHLSFPENGYLFQKLRSPLSGGNIRVLDTYPNSMGLRDLEVVIWSPTPLLLNKSHRICIQNILQCTYNARNSSDFPHIQSPNPGQINSVVFIASTKAEKNMTI